MSDTISHVPLVCPGCPQRTGVPCGEGRPQLSRDEGASSLEQDRILNNTQLGNHHCAAQQKSLLQGMTRRQGRENKGVRDSTPQHAGGQAGTQTLPQQLGGILPKLMARWGGSREGF